MKCPKCGEKLPQYIPKGRRYVTGPFETREELRDAVVKLSKEGWKGIDIAKKFGISNATTSRLLRGDKPQTINGVRRGLWEL